MLRSLFLCYIFSKNEEGKHWDDGGIQESRRKRIRISHPSDEDTQDTLEIMDVTES